MRMHVDHASGTRAALSGIACAPGPLCVAADGGGNLISSTNPTGGARAWKSFNLNLGYPLSGQMSCASIALCVAIGAGVGGGDVLSSANPTGTASAWSRASVDTGVALTSLSCVSTKLCVVGDQNGNVIIGRRPG
jgi:hypothetical protein